MCCRVVTVGACGWALWAPGASAVSVWYVPFGEMAQVTIRSIFWALDRMYALITPGVRSLWYVVQLDGDGLRRKLPVCASVRHA